jgi:hypothetical protein
MSEKSGGRGGGATAAPGGIPLAIRERIVQGSTRVEDVVYIGLGICSPRAPWSCWPTARSTSAARS